VSLLVRGASQIVTPIGSKAKPGNSLGELSVVHNHALLCTEGKISGIGTEDELRDLTHDELTVLDVDGCCVLPGFVDPHTHPVWAGSREDEFNRRLRGEGYMEIAASGGGINSTVEATRGSSFRSLLGLAVERLNTFLRHGTTTIEAKSGYGLDLETEVRMLEVINRASDSHVVDLIPTCLAAHEVPREFRSQSEAYVDLLIDKIHPRIADLGIATAIDVFCEEGVFDLDQTRRILADAPAYGWQIHLHADELTPLGGAELAVELGALSADHLIHVSEAGINALAGSDTVAVLLPGTSFFLRESYAPARTMVDAGCTVALATDFNPGSSPTESMPTILALACLGMGLTIEEAITAATLNSAAALDRGDTLGSLEIGKQADLIVLNAPTYHHLVYHHGVNPVRHVVKNGAVVVRDGAIEI
jgi:imidazolonepropionase